MKRKFITNLILLLFLNLLIKPFYIFGIDRTVQNLVGDQSYGLYFSLFSFSIILNILLDVGITSYNNRNIAQHQFLLSKHLSNIVGLKFLLAILYAVVSIVLAFIIGYDNKQLHLLFFLIFNQFLISFTLYLRSNISGLHLFRTDSLVSVLDRTIMIAIMSVLLFSNRFRPYFTIEWFVYAQTAGYVLTSMITFGIVLRKSGRIKLRYNRGFFMVMLRKSYPYAILVLLMSLYNRIDSVILERMLTGPVGKEQAGIYAQAFRLLDAVSNFGVLFGGLLLPIFARMIKQKEPVGQMVKLAYTLIIVPSIILAISSIYYNEEIMSMLYQTNTAHSSLILGILMTGFIGIATTYIFGTLLTANGSIRQLNMVAFAGMILNISLNLLLIPRLMAFGSAYASLITQILTAAAQVALAAWIFKLKIDFAFIIRLVLFTGVVVLLGTLSGYFSKWGYGYLFMIAASALSAFLLGLFNLRDLYKIIVYK